jgi:hypothetical protein
MFSYIFNY